MKPKLRRRPIPSGGGVVVLKAVFGFRYSRGVSAVLEAHLLDFPADGESGDLYGQIGRVDFVQFLRSERRFNGIDELSAQLANDVEATRTVLSQI